jgi:sterol desaturase/sphingolipid hydroxylase (fatty acid hydroxylase superfamily)
MFHRMTHEYTLIYRYFHKTHHQEHFPTLLSTFRHNLFDLILTNTIPFFIFWK